MITTRSQNLPTAVKEFAQEVKNSHDIKRIRTKSKTFSREQEKRLKQQ